MRTAFDECFDVMIAHEGGYANDPKDPGGETMYGITRRDHPTWDGWKYVDSAKPLKNNAKVPIVLPSAKKLYEAIYWKPINGNAMAAINQTLALHVFDFAVNAGVDRASKILQIIVNATPDGKIGPKTLAAVKAMDVARVVSHYSSARSQFYSDLAAKKGMMKFLKSWLARVSGCDSAFPAAVIV